MNLMTIMMMITMMITATLMILASMISKKLFLDREKSSPFECGFDPKSSARLPFSLQFFMIALIFLIFDVEITLLLPFIMTTNMMNPIKLLFLMTIFITILLMGLYHEWKQGALNWTL